MYLTRMELDTEKRATRKLLCSRSKIHGMVESAFSGGRERRLWRLDTLGGGLYLLVREASTRLGCIDVRSSGSGFCDEKLRYAFGADYGAESLAFSIGGESDAEQVTCKYR